MSPTGSHVCTVGPQLVMLSFEGYRTLGDGALAGESEMLGTVSFTVQAQFFSLLPDYSNSVTSRLSCCHASCHDGLYPFKV